MIQVTVLVTSEPTRGHFTCIMWNSTDNQPIKLRSDFQFISDWRRPKYYSGRVKCSLSGLKTYYTEISLIPTSVSLRHQHLKYPQNLLHIKYPVGSFRRNVTRCVHALRDLKDPVAVVQMIEADILMGTDYFVFYDYKNNHLKDVFLHYQKKGVLEILPWNLPIASNSDEDVHYHAQFLHIHDCILRNLDVSKYLFLADLDEIFVSRKYNKWREITDEYLKPMSSCGSVSFQTAFFVPGKNTDLFPLKDLAEEYQLTFFLWIRHTHFYPHSERSKLLLDPRKVSIGNIHAIDKFIYPYKMCFMDKKDGFIHHYRDTEKHLDLVENVDIYQKCEVLIKNIVLVLNTLKRSPGKLS